MNPIEIFLKVMLVIGITVAIVFIEMVAVSIIEALGDDEKKNDDNYHSK